MSAHELVEILIEKKLTLSVAESLTAGLLASKIAEVSGVSKVFKGGVVAYQNQIKSDVLGLRQETLEKYGAVSQETVIEMAAGVGKKFNTSVAIATSGIAGPNPAEGKPVGLVFIGVWADGETWVEHLQLTGGREMIRQATCGLAIEFALEILQNR